MQPKLPSTTSCFPAPCQVHHAKAHAVYPGFPESRAPEQKHCRQPSVPTLYCSAHTHPFVSTRTAVKLEECRGGSLLYSWSTTIGPHQWPNPPQCCTCRPHCVPLSSSDHPSRKLRHGPQSHGSDAFPKLRCRPERRPRAHPCLLVPPRAGPLGSSLWS